MYTTHYSHTPHLRLLLMVAFVLCAAVSGFAQSKSVPTDKPNAAPPVQLKYEGTPQGNTIADQITRAEFFKAQYPNDPTTQVKYQLAIDELKKQQTAPAKKD
jgi:membrane-bound lytic murein transglycosylase B